MPPLPVITDVYRVTWNFLTAEGVTPRIVQHYWSPSSDVSVLGASLVAAEEDFLFSPMPAQFEPDTIDVLPLDGTTPTQTFNTNGSKQLCHSGLPMMPSTAMIMSIRTDQRGPRGRGRSYIGPIGESDAEDGRMVGDGQAECLTAWTAFITTLLSLSPQVQLVVASYTHGDFHPITSAPTFETVCGTQRRRQSQLRV